MGRKLVGGSTKDKDAKGSSQLKLNNRKYISFCHLNKFISLGFYERKGIIHKRSMNADKHEFKKRQFVLHGEKLFYYKKNKTSNNENYFNLISL